MRTSILASLIGASLCTDRIYRGQCVDMNRNFFKELGKEDFDPSKIQGTWFEMFRDKMTYWELTGKCNYLTAKLSKSETTTPITIKKVNIKDT